jgi:hypothetical protein
MKTPPNSSEMDGIQRNNWVVFVWFSTLYNTGQQLNMTNMEVNSHTWSTVR